jgi:SAM-dependent methyltransferase
MPSPASSFDQLITEADQHTMIGWDFSELAERWREEVPSWNYKHLVEERLPAARAVLDMGTGGGELLASLAPLPADTTATEGYAPNIPVAQARLEPLGIAVVSVGDDELLPFPDERFDLIINRHEAYSATEIRRVLRPGGVFITQQVGGQDNIALNHALQDEVSVQYGHWNLAYAIDEVTRAGLKVSESGEEFPLTRFADVGAIIHLLKATPWQVEGFSVIGCRDRLRAIHEMIQANGHFETRSHRFYLVAHKK